MSESVEGGTGWKVLAVLSIIKETVLGGLARATGVEDKEEEEDEEDEDEDEAGLLTRSLEGPVSKTGGSRACLGKAGLCWQSCTE